MPVKMSIIKNKYKTRDNILLSGQKECQYTVDGNEIWYGHYRKQYEASTRDLKKELPYDLEIPLLVIYLKKVKTLIRKDMFTSMFMALFTTAKIQK